jgi:hypothetical protein
VTVDASDGKARRTFERNAFIPTLQLYDLDTVVETGTVLTEMSDANTYQLTFSHTDAGIWQLALRSGDAHAVGSPFQVCKHACARCCMHVCVSVLAGKVCGLFGISPRTVLFLEGTSITKHQTKVVLCTESVLVAFHTKHSLVGT